MWTLQEGYARPERYQGLRRKQQIPKGNDRKKSKSLGYINGGFALGFEAEILYPVELLGGVGDEHAAGLGDAAEGVVGGETFAAEEGGE